MKTAARADVEKRAAQGYEGVAQSFGKCGRNFSGAGGPKKGLLGGRGGCARSVHELAHRLLGGVWGVRAEEGREGRASRGGGRRVCEGERTSSSE